MANYKTVLSLLFLFFGSCTPVAQKPISGKKSESSPYPGPCTAEFDENLDNVIDSRTTFIYDEKGNELGFHLDKNNDGHPDLRARLANPGEEMKQVLNPRATYTFDKKGNKRVEEIDNDQDGKVDARITYTYDCWEREHSISVRKSPNSVSFADIARTLEFIVGPAKERILRYENNGIKAKGPAAKNAEGAYIRNGHWVFYWKSGAKKAEGNYSNAPEGGKLDSNGILLKGRQGDWTIWHANGQVKFKGSYAKGKTLGERTRWYENGNMSRSGSSNNAGPQGLWSFWHPSGEKSAQGTFKNGKRRGEWIWWDKHGVEKERQTFGKKLN